MTFRYIGSKARLIEQIASHIHPPTDGSFFVDAFCGTGVVAEAAAKKGWNIRINDHLHSAVISAWARLVSAREINFNNLGGYIKAIEELNNSQPIKGYIWQTYSPASSRYCEVERKYFTEENAGKIDAMRNKIAVWRHEEVISQAEERLLIADLFAALNRVANIAGTFGCFLSKWTRQSQYKIVIKNRELKTDDTVVEATVGDVFDVANQPHDLVYLDPPYTKRQYASYYHILETVALNDTPEVKGVAGLRPWKNLASDFCYKTRALNTLSCLIESLNANKVLLSYSSEGHISMRDMEKKLSSLGRFTSYPLGTVGRYRPNKAASSTGSDVNEFLIDFRRNKCNIKNERMEILKNAKEGCA